MLFLPEAPMYKRLLTAATAVFLVTTASPAPADSITLNVTNPYNFPDTALGNTVSVTVTSYGRKLVTA